MDLAREGVVSPIGSLLRQFGKFDSRHQPPMNTITTTLKRKWFAEIVDRDKRIEYRNIKPYWTTRLRAVTVPFRLVLSNGMLPPVPVVTVRIDRVVPSPWGKKRSGKYALHIGRVLKVEHWDRVKKRPRRERNIPCCTRTGCGPFGDGCSGPESFLSP